MPFPLDRTTPWLFSSISCNDPSSNITITTSAHPADLLSQPLKLRPPRTKQVPYLPQILDGSVLLELLSRVLLHLCSRWRRYLVACTGDGAVEGYGALAEEEVVEGKGGLFGWGKAGGARAGCCVAAGEDDGEVHVGVRSTSVWKWYWEGWWSLTRRLMAC